MKTVTQKDIAKKLGISQSAVTAALGKISNSSTLRVGKPLRRRICQTAERLGYYPNRMAQAMRTQKTGVVGLLFPNLRTGFHNLKVEAMERVLVEKGYQVMVGFTRGEEDRVLNQVRLMVEHWVDGLVIMGGGTANVKSEILPALLARRQTPCIMVDCTALAAEIPQIWVDRVGGMEQLMEYLLEIGHRDFLYLSATGNITSKIKARGIARAFEKFGRRDSSARLRWAPSDARGWRPFEEMEASVEPPRAPNSFDPLALETHAYHKAQEVAAWPDRPSVVVAPTDTEAMAFIQGAKNAGLRVPRDMAVTGFENGIDARYCDPPLTTMDQPREEMAIAAVDMLMNLMDGKPLESTDVLCPCRLVARQSCGGLAAKARMKADVPAAASLLADRTFSQKFPT